MDTLSIKEKELVAIGAAIGANCVPCVAYHVAEAKKAGLSAEQIGEAIALAAKVKKVPTDLVLNTAYAYLEDELGDVSELIDDNKPSCCG